jgi:MarR family transcriptional regulator, organic hydroperoxide resistance regulator
MGPCVGTPGSEHVHPLQRFMHLYMRRAVRDMNDLLRDQHLSMPQMGTLHFLHAEGARSVSAIAEHLNLSLAATSHLVDRLVQRGLLSRTEDPIDRRQKSVALAEPGIALIDRIHRQAAVAFDELLAPLPTELRQRFERDVHEVLEVLTAPAAIAR